MDCSTFAFDLHVLGTPPALILSQDQTLMLNGLASRSPKDFALRGAPNFSRAIQHNLLTRGRLALRCSIRYLIMVHYQSLVSGLTTQVDSLRSATR